MDLKESIFHLVRYSYIIVSTLSSLFEVRSESIKNPNENAPIISTYRPQIQDKSELKHLSIENSCKLGKRSTALAALRNSRSSV